MDYSLFTSMFLRRRQMEKCINLPKNVQRRSVITNLTYRNIGKIEAVDTRLFRMAVHRYAQCLFGIRHDDYDYSQINILLPRYIFA